VSDHLRHRLHTELRAAQRRALLRPGFRPGDGTTEMFGVIEEHLAGAGISLDDEARRALRWMAGWDPGTVAAIVSLMLAGRPAQVGVS